LAHEPHIALARTLPALAHHKLLAAVVHVVLLLVRCCQGGKVFLVIMYPNSRNTEVRARCAIRGVPCLGAANRLDMEELLSYDRDTATSASMIPAGE